MSEAPHPAVFYDASDMVHDLPGEPASTSATPRPAPPATLMASREAELAELGKASDGLPFGADVGVALTRAAHDVGASAAEAEAVTAEWLGTFAAHGIAQDDAHTLIEIGASVTRGGPPSEEMEAGWISEIEDRLAREFGGQEAAERAADLAAAYIARDKRLCEWLEATRLGGHPRVVLAIAKAAHNARKAGKF